MAALFATRFQTIEAGNDETIESGNPIIVHDIVLTTDTAETVTFTDASLNTLFTLRAIPGSRSMDIKWIADKGLKVTQTTDTSVIIFYELSG